MPETPEDDAMTADILTEKGNNGKPFAKINEVVFGVPGFLVPKLDEIAVGETVGFNETNNILTKIWKKRKTEKQAYIVVPPNGNGNGKNQKLITFLALHRDAVSMFQTTNPLSDQGFNDAMDQVYERAKKDLDRAMADCGEVT